METLIDILSHSRAHGSDGEKIIIEKYILPLTPTIVKDEQGEDMAYIIDVGDGDSQILWSCHTDTVHYLKDNVHNSIIVEGDIIRANGHSILGADDGAGMWLLLEMIKEGVEGTYIFHRGEECGGIGSSYLAKNYKEFLSKFTHAVAFDRKGTNSIITHQFGRCCSNKFANQLSEYFLDNGLYMKPDSGGIFTDTANYVGIIPECTNISVGYEYAHTSRELLDVSFLFNLRNAMTKTKRHQWDVFNHEDEQTLDYPLELYFSLYDMFAGMDYDSILFYITNYPEELADLIEKWVA